MSTTTVEYLDQTFPWVFTDSETRPNLALMFSLYRSFELVQEQNLRLPRADALKLLQDYFWHFYLFEVNNMKQARTNNNTFNAAQVSPGFTKSRVWNTAPQPFFNDLRLLLVWIYDGVQPQYIPTCYRDAMMNMFNNFIVDEALNFKDIESLPESLMLSSLIVFYEEQERAQEQEERVRNQNQKKRQRLQNVARDLENKLRNVRHRLEEM